MRINDLANRLGLSPHTLRYYEKIGLIRGVDRVGGRRSYSSDDLVWMEFILRLKETGMPLKEIRRYADLRHEGDTTLTQRKEMLLSHRQELEAEIARLQTHKKALDTKIGIYETWEEEYESVRKRDEEA